MRMAICLAALAASAHASGAVSSVALSDVAFSQPAGRGDALITYSLGEAPAIITVDVQTNSLDNGEGEWTSLGGGIVKSLSGDFGIVRKTGACSIRWACAKDWPGRVVATGRIRAVVSAWATNAPPDWMVVGLGKQNDVRFYAESNHVPEGVESDLYKGAELLMRRIPAAGRVWTMGITPEEYDDETMVPTNNMPHRVMLTRDYFMGVYEVTQGQYTNIGMSAASGFTGYEDSWKRPVSHINNGAMRGALASLDGKYNAGPSSACGLIYAKTGVEFDLPTEAQWEYACRAGTTSAFNNGGGCTDDDYDEVGWNGNNSKTGTTDNKMQPHAVGLLSPNSYGLYDMHGNVQEVCLDRWTSGTDWLDTFAPGFEDGSVTIDPRGGSTWSTANRIVVRGGSYTSGHGRDLGRSGNRGEMTYTYHGDYNGFRLCCPAVFR